MSEPRDLAAHYARNRVRHDRAAQEWADRQPYGSFELSADAAAWADAEVAGAPVAQLPLVRATTREWSAWLGLRSPYLGTVASVLATRAVVAGVLRVPEPGIVGTAYANRHRETEQEVALGWGFRPEDAEALVLHAERSLPFDELAGGPDVLGGAAVLALLRGVVETLADVRVGPTSSRDLMLKAAQVADGG